MKKKDILIIGTILSFIALATYVNLQVSIRRARDFQRKEDIRHLANGLASYQDAFGIAPLSRDGLIIACEPVDLSKLSPVFSPCQWGKDSLRDLSDPGFPAFVETIPGDPKTGEGRSYYYLSNGKDFQVYAALESSDEAEYDPKIVARGIKCGNATCNFGLSSGVPLDKSLEEYNNEIRLKKNP